MSQEENSGDEKGLNDYFLAIESFENLESLFHTDQINFTSLVEELSQCYDKIDNILMNENDSSKFLVDLFQLKRHMLTLKHFVQACSEQEIAPTKQHPSPIYASSAQDSKDAREKLPEIVESTLEIPCIAGLREIAGLWEVKKVLRTLVILPQTQPQLFTNRKCNSILLFGPPGTGKTRLVHALAYESKAVLHSVSLSNMMSPYVGKTEKNLQMLFEYVRNSNNFTIVFIDEVDGFCRTRKDSEQEHSRRMKTELMCQLSRVEESRNVFLICVTNCPWELDPAFLRRFQRRVYIPLPGRSDRLELFGLFLKEARVGGLETSWEELVDKTEGYSGSDLSNLVQQAINIPIMELEDTKIWKRMADGFYEPVISAEDFNIDDIVCRSLSDMPPCSVRARPVQMLDLENSLDSSGSTVSPTDVKRYELFIKR